MLGTHSNVCLYFYGTQLEDDMRAIIIIAAVIMFLVSCLEGKERFQRSEQCEQVGGMLVRGESDWICVRIEKLL